MKKITLFFLMLAVECLSAQNGIGINTSAPQALLDIQAKNTDTPENSAGMLFPTVSRFSSVDPAQIQNGMLVFLDNAITAGFEGYYFWDDPKKLWQYLFQTKILGKNLFKTIASGNGFPVISNSDTNTNAWFKTSFTGLKAPDANYTLQNGDVVVGKTGNYSVFFTGGVYKNTGDTGATVTEVGIFIDNGASPVLIAKSPLPSADNAKRSTNHTISNIITLTKGQRISVQTRRTSSCTTEVGPESVYTLTLSYLD
ncbi:MULTISPECIES: hypothetical protein [Chryseobacterium]|uniref:hypothetical protein n=1 Tax=Chryseobacterium TaxID=59732 RepID=UPI00192D71F9|nr:hypothetical protein [Chryseobacterium cucumeris]QRA42011.1 hypothetical protein JNG87_15435 [Chryseobacterium cucumeris]